MTDVTQRAAPAPADAATLAVEIRPLREAAEYRAAIALQRATWGAGYHEVVPASVLKLTQRLGGVASGAFDETGALIGFVYGLTGLVEGRLIHWSHMLAVRGACRNNGVGRQLKEHQRGLLHAAGIEEIRWTFDPLVARNGHLNLNVLGASVAEYVLDAYGDSGSDLHTFGTDRFVVRWPVATDGAARIPTNGAAPPADVPVVNAAPGEAAPVSGSIWASPWIAVQVPADVESMRHDAVDVARAWRASTRPAFLDALGRGYEVAGFAGGPGRRGLYLLHRPAA